MNSAKFRFYGELNDFLPISKQGTAFSHSFRANPSLRDMLCSFGVPAAEVDLILVNDKSVDFSYKLENDDNVSVYPVFESFDITDVTHLRARPLRVSRFILDVHLGKLAKYMRLLGFDSSFSSSFSDDEIIRASTGEKRIILTRDRGLLQDRRVTHGYCVRSEVPFDQAKEVVRKFDLAGSAKPFTLCLVCGVKLVPASKDEIMDKLQPGTLEYYDEFRRCPGCGRIYWEGTHYEKMKKITIGLLSH